MRTGVHHGGQASVLQSSCPSDVSPNLQHGLWWLQHWLLPHQDRDANLHEDHPSPLQDHAKDQEDGQGVQACHVLCRKGIRSVCLQDGTTDQDGEMLQTCYSLCRGRGGSVRLQDGTTDQDCEMLQTSVHHGNGHEDCMLP